MKVLIINTVCGNGSTGKICANIAEILIKNGHECKIAYGRGKAPKKYNNISIKIGNWVGVLCNALNARLFDNEGFNAKHATKRVIKWIKKYNPDIIHLHNLHGYYININILFNYLKTSGKKIIWTLHDCWSMTGHCANFVVANCDRWKMGCYNCKQLKEYPSSILFDHSTRNYDIKKKLFVSLNNYLTLVSPSSWLANLVKESYLKDYPIKVINNGIDLEVFKPTNSEFKHKYNIENKKILLGVAFDWSYKKGLDIFIELSKLIDNNIYQIVLVGTTKEIDKMLPNNIISIHKTNNQKELAEIYSSAYAFINPTREEVLGMVNIESLACGTPVITFNTGGSPECINSSTGIVTKEKTAQSILEELPNVDRIKRNDCINYAKNFDMNVKFEEYLKLYKEIIKKD